MLLFDPLWLLLSGTSLSPLTFHPPLEQCSLIAKDEHLNSPRGQIWGVNHAKSTNQSVSGYVVSAQGQQQFAGTEAGWMLLLSIPVITLC